MHTIGRIIDCFVFKYYVLKMFGFLLYPRACGRHNPFIFAGIEARGFIFGPPIALAIGAKFVPMRKPKKLPGNSF